MDEHRAVNKALGFKEEDFRLFGGESATDECDEGKSVRLIGPYGLTSYSES